MNLKKVNVTKLIDYKHIIFILLLLCLMIHLAANPGDLKSNITSQILLLKGNYAYTNSAYDDAEVLYRTALRKYPGLEKVQYNLGNAYYKQGRYEEAIKIYIKCTKEKESSLKIKSWNNLGNAYYMSGNLKNSADAFMTALLLSGGDSKIRQNLLFILNKMDLKSDNVILAKREKDQSLKDKRNKNSQSKNGDDKKGDKTNNLADAKLSNKTIVDLFNHINQSEEDTRNRINKSKFKNNSEPSNGPDY